MRQHAFSHFSALRYDDRYFGFIVGSRGNVLDLSDDEETLDDASEDDVLGVEEVALGASDEELTAVGVLARVGHGQQARPGMLQPEILVGEIGSVDAHGAGSVAVNEISPLDHKIFDDAMELGVFEARRHAVPTKFAGAELPEVFRRSRHHVGEQFHLHPADFRVADGDVEEHHRIRSVCHFFRHFSFHAKLGEFFSSTFGFDTRKFST